MKEEGKLKRTLGVGECVFFGVGSILGAGIYAVVGKVAGFSGNMIWLSFLVASVTALLSAFSYAELVSMFPRAGGEYTYAKISMGKKTGVFLGSLISINGIVSGAAVSLGFGGYFIELFDTNQLIAAGGIILLIAIVNILGIRESSTVNIIFTVIEVAGLVFVIYAAFPDLGKVDLLKLPDQRFHGLFTAAALSFFAYIGFEEIVKLAEETKNPQKNIPRALFIATGIVILFYFLISVSVVNAVPSQQLAASESPLADVVDKRFGNVSVITITAIALFSTGNTILSNMIGSSRVIMQMSKESSLFKKLGFISPQFGTPVFALLLIAVVMGSLAMIGKITTVALIANFFIYLTFLLVNVSVIVLRIKDKETERAFRIPWSIKNIPVISVAAIIMILVLMSYSIYGIIVAGARV